MYDFLDLVNGLGGLLGLFLGYSVLSLLEYCRHTVYIFIFLQSSKVVLFQLFTILWTLVSNTSSAPQHHVDKVINSKDMTSHQWLAYSGYNAYHFRVMMNRLGYCRLKGQPECAFCTCKDIYCMTSGC